MGDRLTRRALVLAAAAIPLAGGARGRGPVPAAPAAPRGVGAVATGIQPTMLRSGRHPAGRHVQGCWLLYQTERADAVADAALCDMLLDACGPLFRGDAKRHANLRFERLRSIDARPSGKGHGLILIGGRIDGLIVRDWSWSSTTPARNSIEAVIRIGGWSKDVAINGGRGIVIERGRAEGAITEGARYENMDVVVVERGYPGTIIRDIVGVRASDSGIDLKPDDCVIDRVAFTACRQTLKLWGSSRAIGRVRSAAPRVAHVLVAGGGTNRIAHLDAGGDPTLPLVRFERRPGHVVLDAGDWAADQQIAVADDGARGSTVTLPDGQVVRV